jgi:hypothetical protein
VACERSRRLIRALRIPWSVTVRTGSRLSLSKCRRAQNLTLRVPLLVVRVRSWPMAMPARSRPACLHRISGERPRRNGARETPETEGSPFCAGEPSWCDEMASSLGGTGLVRAPFPNRYNSAQAAAQQSLISASFLRPALQQYELTRPSFCARTPIVVATGVSHGPATVAASVLRFLRYEFVETRTRHGVL